MRGEGQLLRVIELGKPGGSRAPGPAASAAPA
jgi:hypothetical protein